MGLSDGARWAPAQRASVVSQEQANMLSTWKLRTQFGLLLLSNSVSSGGWSRQSSSPVRSIAQRAEEPCQNAERRTPDELNPPDGQTATAQAGGNRGGR